MIYTTKLLHKNIIAEGTEEFHFLKPEGFVFEAGQTIDLTLINPTETDAEGNSRTFSIVSAPHEAHIVIATRMRDTAFKNSLKHMPLGTELSFEGPFGSFILHENTARPAVFLAGGIGITPFHSIVSDATTRELPHALILFYSNRRPEDTAFLSEFRAFEKENSRFTMVPTMTNMEESKEVWQGGTGFIDAQMLKRHIPNDASPIYYLAGPETMISAMRTMLTDSGISRDDIRFEEFAGY